MARPPNAAAPPEGGTDQTITPEKVETHGSEPLRLRFGWHSEVIEPAAEQALAHGLHVHVPGAVVVPDVEVIEHAANGHDLTEHPGYPVRDRGDERSAWILSDGEP